MLLSQRYVVKIPLKEPPEVLGDFRSSALLELTLYRNVLCGGGGEGECLNFSCVNIIITIYFITLFFLCD